MNDSVRLLFLVGMPRSGTKLLRGLLNNHPRVFIPDFETEFFFYWKNQWDKFGDLSCQEVFQDFYRQCQNIPYFMYLRAHNQEIDWKRWHQTCVSFTPESVFIAMLMCQAMSKPNASVIGDKSPSYLGKVEQLQRAFPTAQFIHITRDVRDYCISINRAWNKDIHRAAFRWGITIKQFSESDAIDRNRIFTIKYESLLADPSNSLEQLCQFLNIDFSADLILLNKATEDIGEARGMTEIKDDNINKFLSVLDENEIAKIEALAYSAMNQLGYKPLYAKQQYHLSRVSMMFLKILDGFNLIRSEVSERGIFGAIRYTYRYHSTSSNSN